MGLWGRNKRAETLLPLLSQSLSEPSQLMTQHLSLLTKLLTQASYLTFRAYSTSLVSCDMKLYMHEDINQIKGENVICWPCWFLYDDRKIQNLIPKPWNSYPGAMNTKLWGRDKRRVQTLLPAATTLPVSHFEPTQLMTQHPWLLTMHWLRTSILTFRVISTSSVSCDMWLYLRWRC